MKLARHYTIIAALIALSGCASPSQFSASPEPANIQSSMTSYTALAQCIGRTIAVTQPRRVAGIVIGEIADATTPKNALSKTLSNGAVFWARALATQMGKQVKVLTKKLSDYDPNGYTIIIVDGAWTQNDTVTDSAAARFKIKFGDLEIGYGADDSYNIIAGDFLWSRYGARHIEGAVSVLTSIKTASSEGDVFVNSDGKGIATTVRLQSTQGVHLSQRTAVEFALSKIIADATGVNMQFCVDQPHYAPEFAQEQAGLFQDMSSARQKSTTQELLVTLGYLDKSNLKGSWNIASRKALRSFLISRGMPPVSTPQMQHYVMLQLAAQEIATHPHPVTPELIRGL